MKKHDSLCRVVLKKGKGQTGNLAIGMKVSSCPNLVKFSIAVAAECSDISPCTNRPIICLKEARECMRSSAPEGKAEVHGTIQRQNMWDECLCIP